MDKLSLNLRLVIGILLVFIITSLITTSISMYQTRKSLIEMFDTQLYSFAKRVSNSNINILLNSSSYQFIKKDEEKMIEKHLSVEDDALTFSIFSTKGDMLYTDEEDSKDFLLNSTVLKMQNGLFFEENKEFRIIWMLSSDKKYVVVVAQEKEYIDDLIFDILEDQLYPWLFIVPFLLLFTTLLIRKELKPLTKLSHDLSLKDAKDSSLLDENTTKELKPVIKALNSLFQKINTMIEKERRFTSNAAHELKTPLSALKVQTEVAKLFLEDKDTLLKSLDNIEIGVDRATRMTNQLLALSRVESINDLENLSNIDFVKLINSIIKELEYKINQKDIDIDFSFEDTQKTIKGEEFMLSLLLLNLLDNAIRYNTKGTCIKIYLKHNSLTIKDNGKGIDQKVLETIGERFIRPSGQKQTGSGLGFSIVQQIAILHNIRINYKNITPNGFKITLFW